MVDGWSPTEFWSRFAIASLVVWRLTHLLAFEDGPFDVIARLRQRAGESFFGKLLDCFSHCSYGCPVWRNEAGTGGAGVDRTFGHGVPVGTSDGTSGLRQLD